MNPKDIGLETRESDKNETWWEEKNGRRNERKVKVLIKLVIEWSHESMYSSGTNGETKMKCEGIE